MVPPKKGDKVRKLVPLKVVYKKLPPFRRELSELRLDFLLWNWNRISASICKEIMDKNKTEGEDLRGNPMLWTIEHWAKVGFFERVMKGQRVHWARIFYDLVWVRIAKTEIEGIKQSRTRARPKRKASRGLIVSKILDNSVEKTIDSIVDTPEVAIGKLTQPVVTEGPLVVEEPGPTPPEEEERMKTSGKEVKTMEITFPDFL
ncbi:hypothetical protein AXG93_2469s1000 [Marchantia polymorpha subsp. ruderalis]|uniref:Uncharacterized protein n=1 Tax=Marchantia polymorpha subsp. ruderalis TaxID=1480154 RepID=A0A176W8M6_MARPO|nr:hypothetical protein AXG93_2469s1000 [Marchantia polymorpha subsp. ruderalis]